jgi:hypothetical protein
MQEIYAQRILLATAVGFILLALLFAALQAGWL